MCKKSNKIYCASAIIISVLFSFLRVVITFLYTEENFGVYVTNSIIPTLFDYTVTAAIIFFAIFPYIFRKSFERKITPEHTSFSKYVGFTLGFIFMFFSFAVLFLAIKGRETPVYEIILAVSAVFSSVYYLSKCMSQSSGSGAKALLSMAPIIFTVTALIEVYFDMDILITSPNRSYHQTALLAFALFLLAETRLELGYENTINFAPCADISAILLSVSSIPNLICYQILNCGHTDRPLIYAIELVAAFYCVSRLISFSKAKNRSLKYTAFPN